MTVSPIVIDCTQSHRSDARWGAEIEGGALVVHTIDRKSSKPISLPKRLNMADLTSERASEWAGFHSKLAASVGSRTIHLVVDFDSPIRDLVRALNAWGLLEYTVHVEGHFGPVRPSHYPFLASATQVTFGHPDDERRLSSNFAGGWRDVSLATVPSVVGDPCLAPLRVLLVAYFAGACGAVGAKRVNYWASQLPAVADGALTVDVASAMPHGTAVGARHHFVPDHGRAELLRPSQEAPDWRVAAIEREIEQSRKFSTVGFYWKYALERYFGNLDHEFDAVVISGNPFAPFEFARWAKRNWGATVLLDYRDPFANNPRMRYAEDVRKEAAYEERGYNLAADAITVVNEDCVGLLAGPRDRAVVVVPNGYDDRVLGSLVVRDPRPSGEVVTLAHAGSFYADRSPAALVSALLPGRQRLVHVGPIGDLELPEGASEVVDVRGGMPYADAMATIATADLGVVYVTETAFETPTKIYDYLGLGLEVLVITEGSLRGGALGQALEGVPGIHWVANRPRDLRKFLAAYVPGPRVDKVHRERFSRRTGTRRLFEELVRLTPSH